MEAEASLLEAFASVPNISRLTVQEGPEGSKWLTVGRGGGRGFQLIIPSMGRFLSAIYKLQFWYDLSH